MEPKIEMPWSTFQDTVVKAIPKLLELAQSLTWNTISDNLEFILTEIKDPEEPIRDFMQLQFREKAKEVPVSLETLLPKLKEHYDNLYDVNLTIYKAESNRTIVEIAYYPKSSLTPEGRRLSLKAAPMLHCKVARPPLFPENKKFNINWEHNPRSTQWRKFRGRAQDSFSKMVEPQKKTICRQKIKNNT